MEHASRALFLTISSPYVGSFYKFNNEGLSESSEQCFLKNKYHTSTIKKYVEN